MVHVLRALPTTLDVEVYLLALAMQGSLPTPMMVLHAVLVAPMNTK